MIPGYDDWKTAAPEMVGPCPNCAAKAAKDAVYTAKYDLIHNADFPAEAIGLFDSMFRGVWCDMANFAADQAQAECKRGDWDYCNDHRPEPDTD